MAERADEEKGDVEWIEEVESESGRTTSCEVDELWSYLTKDCEIDEDEFVRGVKILLPWYDPAHIQTDEQADWL